MNHRLIGGHGAAGPSLRGSREQQEHAYASFARFCDGTAASLCEQATSARAAAQNAQKIVDVAQRVGQLGNTARMVALNARVESSRLGAAGAPFAVLAVEIRGITDTILGLSEEIEQLGAHLKQVIPRLADGATALVGSHREVGEDLKLRMREAASTQRAALDEVEATAQAGYERADRIVAKLHKVLQHLQFQDRIAQDVHAVVKQDAASLALVEDELRRVEEGATRSGSFSASAEQAERLSHAISEVDRATLSSDDDEELVQGDALFFG